VEMARACRLFPIPNALVPRLVLRCSSGLTNSDPRLLAAQRLPALHNYIHVFRVEFDPAADALRQFRGRQRGAAAQERLVNQLPALRGPPGRQTRYLVIDGPQARGRAGTTGSGHGGSPWSGRCFCRRSIGLGSPSIVVCLSTRSEGLDSNCLGCGRISGACCAGLGR
jgi:hypothetical protein